MRAQMKDAIHRSFAYTKAIEFAALLVALLGLLNTLLISVLERTQEIGMMRAIGTTKAQIARLILGESLIQGSFGAMVAVGIGGWVAKLWIENSLAHILGWIVTFKFPMESALITVGIGIFVAALAGVYPAKRAADLAITEALEHE
jgi:putative ABC transport system permease protein